MVHGRKCTKVCKQTRSDILSLLNSRELKIKDEAIRPGDIAILVNSHDQARALKKELSNYQVPSVISNSGNVFDSQEALDLLKFLHFVESPSDKNLNSFLLSNFFSYSALQIKAASQK